VSILSHYSHRNRRREKKTGYRYERYPKECNDQGEYSIQTSWHIPSPVLKPCSLSRKGAGLRVQLWSCSLQERKECKGYEIKLQ